MSRTFGRYGPAFGGLGRAAAALAGPALQTAFASRGYVAGDGATARRTTDRLRSQLRRGRPVYLVGLGVSGHNSGAALVEVADDTVRTISNHEEERYTGIKHYGGFPTHSLQAVVEDAADLGVAPDGIGAWLGSWSYSHYLAAGLQALVEHVPHSLTFLRPSTNRAFNYTHAVRALAAPTRLARSIGADGRVPIIAMRHHDNHAHMAYLASPFQDGAPVVVTVVDGYGDGSAISVYLASPGRMQRLYTNDSMLDSLGLVYAMLSSTLGGWTPLSSEGRYMGAAAWGNGDRLTNRYYRRLRQLFYFGADGRVLLNRAMTAMHLYGERAPYNAALREILGEPIPPERMWNPDAVLRVDDIAHSAMTQERVDKAAAVQLLLEDAVTHIVQDAIERTRCHRVVMAGGTALNCVATMRLLERFDERLIERCAGVSRPLEIWVPPTPGDQGVTIGAAYGFASRIGATRGEPFRHAFLCGRTPTRRDIAAALDANDIGTLDVSVLTPDDLADFVAFLLSRDAVVGLYQGRAETGPRALGHRSILANPCNPHTLERINTLVKYREVIRPLAPMVTRTAAERFFHLAPGASAADYNAYNYMVLTAQARPEAHARIPAVVHRDGTSRLQIVRPEIDPFAHAVLVAMGRRCGVEVAVNTSLNVGSPIAQTPAQAVTVLRRARGLTALVLRGADGGAYLAWHAVTEPPKDGGRELHRALAEWQSTYLRLPSVGADIHVRTS